MTSWRTRKREKFTTSTGQQGFGCARNMGTRWPEAGTRDSCGPQLCAWHGTSPRQLVGSVASAAFAAANLARHMMTLSLLRRDSYARGTWEPNKELQLKRKLNLTGLRAIPLCTFTMLDMFCHGYNKKENEKEQLETCH